MSNNMFCHIRSFYFNVKAMTLSLDLLKDNSKPLKYSDREVWHCLTFYDRSGDINLTLVTHDVLVLSSWHQCTSTVSFTWTSPSRKLSISQAHPHTWPGYHFSSLMSCSLHLDWRLQRTRINQLAMKSWGRRGLARLSIIIWNTFTILTSDLH